LTTSPLTLLRWTRFESDSAGTGPEKRSAQILALCTDAGFAVHDMQPPARLPRWRTYAAGLGARRRFGRHASVDRAGIGLLGFRAAFYRNALSRHQGARVLLWETTYDTLLPAFARDAGFRVIALPHNLEALVSDAVFADSRYDPSADLAGELARLALADERFAIAKPERWWLEARGLATRYLPFFPDPALARECHRLRERRAARAASAGGVRGPLLILGSARNPATARGMNQQLAWLTGNPPLAADVVAIGPGTDIALAAHRAPRVQVLGGVSRAALVEHLASCSALLIHTVGGAGAVTRIPEALLAGIPVIANANAARDAAGTPGVHVYENAGEFLALTRAALPPPPPPPRPVAAETRFQSVLRRLCADSLSHA
jgi:glycosyltransferase involved in cell wall biosynthesis